MARWAARLYAAAGLLAFVGLLSPAQPGRDAALVAALACADLAVAGVILRRPATRWNARGLALVAAAGLVLVFLFALSGAVPAYGYPTFFLVLFTWIGVALPRGYALRFALPAAVAYVVPPLVNDGPDELVASVAVAVPIMVLVAECSAAVISRLDRLNAALARAATSDDLTGVGNRRRVEELLRGLEPGDAVVMIDVDHFKEINDRDGHAAGDRVLVQLGALLRRVIRDDDLIARYGGEEFVVIARGAGDEAPEVAERIASAWKTSVEQPTLSLGVAVHDGLESPAETLRRADAAVYDAKRAGRDRVCLAPMSPEAGAQAAGVA